MMTCLTLAAHFLLLSFSSAFSQPSSQFPSVPDVITKYGYPVEEDFVKTPDNYILRIHRIPPSNSSSNNKVVFLMHGLLCSSADWVLAGPNHSLSFILSDNGYDVWMGNARGNHQSRNHTTLSPNDPKFWQFSWHEIGAIDLPTMIDYVLARTNQTQLYLIGHSQGTTTFYVMTSIHPEYNAKIITHYSLAPVAYMQHMTSPLLRVMAYWSGPLYLLSELIGVDEFFPGNTFIALVASLLCTKDEITQGLCTNSLYLLFGFSPKEMNATILPLLSEYTPAGCSVMQTMHYAQEVKSGRFCQYDFGSQNELKYGSTTPPSYDLTKITTPIYMFYSNNDWMSNAIDVNRLCQGLGASCVDKVLVSDFGVGFNHMDYLYGKEAPNIIYSRLVNLLDNNNNN